eukprot:scaffold662_cov364-Pavlova_lutheri.AAC.9
MPTGEAVGREREQALSKSSARAEMLRLEGGHGGPPRPPRQQPVPRPKSGYFRFPLLESRPSRRGRSFASTGGDSLGSSSGESSPSTLRLDG